MVNRNNLLNNESGVKCNLHNYVTGAYSFVNLNQPMNTFPSSYM